MINTNTIELSTFGFRMFSADQIEAAGTSGYAR
jgi:hypothetical protein